MMRLPKKLGSDTFSGGGTINEWGGYYIQDKDVTVSDSINLDELNYYFDNIYDVGLLSNWADFYEIYMVCDTSGTFNAGSIDFGYTPPYVEPFNSFFPQVATLPDEPDLSISSSWDVTDVIIGVAISGSNAGLGVTAQTAMDFMGSPLGTLSVNFVVHVKKIVYLRGSEEYPSYT